jgi:hypothetical protein
VKDRIKGLWVKVVLASMALPTSLAHASSGEPRNPLNHSLENSMEWAAIPGNTQTPHQNFLSGLISPLV